MLCTEYLDHSDETRAVFTPDGIRTGDLGWLDAAGRLTLTGRIKQMINVAGAKVAPREVEDTLLTHEAITEAIVFGTRVDDFNETVVAVAVPHPGCIVTEQELRAHCRDASPPTKSPPALTSCPSCHARRPASPTSNAYAATFVLRDFRFARGGSLERT